MDGAGAAGRGEGGEPAAPAAPVAPVAGPDPGRPSLAERARHGRDVVAARAERLHRQAEEARPRSAVVDAAFRAVEHDSLTGGPVLAGAVAFRLFLVLIPYVFVVVMALGFSVDDGTSSRDLASRAGIGGLVASAVGGTADLSALQRALAVVLGLATLLIATRTCLKVLRVVHALIWGERPQRRPTAKPVLACLALLTAFLLVGVAIRRIEDASFALGLVAMVLAVVLPTGVWLAASWFLPHADAPWWALLPGAVVFGLGVEVLHLVTVYWIAREIESKSDLYGTIGTALALLLWAFLMGRIITLAAVVNATLWRRHRPPSPAAGPG